MKRAWHYRTNIQIKHDSNMALEHMKVESDHADVRTLSEDYHCIFHNDF